MLASAVACTVVDFVILGAVRDGLGRKEFKIKRLLP
jgi:hypothetical protein